VITQQFVANAGVFVAAVLFGSSVVAVRVAMQEVPPLSLAVLRFGQGGVLLVFVLLLLGMRSTPGGAPTSATIWVGSMCRRW
jgi:drug/metabolite transporter (DMT)-like permease